MTRPIRSHVAVVFCGVGIVLIAGALRLVHAAYQAPSSLEGVVVSTDAPAQPIRRAIVMLTGAELPTNLSAITDDRGGFSFVNLRPGSYTVTVSKDAYLTTALGAKQPGQSGTPLVLGAGQRATGVRLVLPRGAVLSGIVRDGSGSPMPNVPITIVSTNTQNGPRIVVPLSQSPIVTDDQGQYRAYELAPAEYLIAASPSWSVRDGLVRLPVPTIDAVMRDLQARASGRATAGVPAPPPAALQTVSYASIFYPGTAVAQDATRIRLAVGEVRDGLDFIVDFVSTVTVAGRVIMADGASPAVVQLALAPVGPPLPVSTMFRPTPQQGPNSTFSIANVTPGRYVLSGRGMAPAGRGSAQAGSLWGLIDFSVNGVDLTDVTLTLKPTLTLSGRIAFHGTSLAVPKDLSAIRLRIVVPERLTGGGMPGSGAAEPEPSPPPVGVVAVDTTFTINGIVPGLYVPAATVPGAPGWRLRSAIVGGRDVLDFPLDFAGTAADVSGAVLTFSDRRSELAGTLQSASGQAATEYFVIVFPADRALWQAGRRLKSTRPASDGRFSVSDLPAGNYLIAALTDLDPDEWRAAAFLEQAAGAAVKVTIADGARVTQNLRLR